MDSFSEHGKTYKIEEAPALWRSSIFDHMRIWDQLSSEDYHGGLHVDPGTPEEPTWSDPEQGTTTCDAIRLRISTKCWEYHGQLGLPRGKLIKENKSGVTLLLSLDDLLAYKCGTNHLWHYYIDRSKDRQIIWRKAGYELYWRVCRIIPAWIDHIENPDEDEDSIFYLPFDYAQEKLLAATEYPGETKALSLQHAADLQAGIKVRIALTESMMMFLHELGVTPEIPHPDAPEWDYGSFEVTPTTLDDLEERCVKITDPVFLDRWKEARKRKVSWRSDDIIYMESGKQFNMIGIIAGQAGGIGRGLYNRIAKARAALEEKAQKAGR